MRYSCLIFAALLFSADVCAKSFRKPAVAAAASALRATKTALEANDQPGLILALDRLMAFYPPKSHDKILKKAASAIQKIDNPQDLQRLRREVRQPRIKKLLVSRTLASAGVTAGGAKQPIVYAPEIWLDPYFALSDFSIRDLQNGGTARFGSPTLYGVRLMGGLPLSSKTELRVGFGFQHFEVKAPPDRNMPVTSLNLFDGSIDIGWRPFATQRLRFGLRGGLGQFPFVMAADVETLSLLQALVPTVGPTVEYDLPLSRVLSLFGQGYGSYFFSSLSSNVTAVSGFGWGLDLSAFARIVPNIRVKIGGQYHYQFTRSSAADQARAWAGGGLGLVYTFSSP